MSELTSRVYELERRVAALVPSIAPISGLAARVTTLEGEMTVAQGQISSLDGRMTGVEGRTTTLEGEMTAVEGRTTTLEGEMTGVEGRTTALEGRMAGVEGRMTGVEGRVTTVEGRTTAVEGRVTALEAWKLVVDGEISDLQIQEAASQLAIEQLDVRVTALEAVPPPPPLSKVILSTNWPIATTAEEIETFLHDTYGVNIHKIDTVIAPAPGSATITCVNTAYAAEVVTYVNGAIYGGNTISAHRV